MAEKQKINLRRLAIVLLGLAVAVATVTFTLMTIKTGSPAPKQPSIVVSYDEAASCRRIVDLTPGRKFLGYSHVHGDGFITTQALGPEDIPRELEIEHLDFQDNRVFCLMTIREHRPINSADAAH